MSQIQVERFSFWPNPKGGSLRWTEHSPANSGAKEHFECGCTKNAAERPTGKPEQVQQRVLYLDPSRNVEFDLVRRHFTIRGATYSPHSYYWFGKDGIQIEICRPAGPKRIPGMYRIEEDPNDVLFAHVYRGNEVDISHFFNGHSPSRLVKLDRLKPDDVWLHRGSGLGGAEAMRFLEREKPFWSEVFDLFKSIRRPTDATISVDEVRANVEADTERLFHIETLVDKLLTFDDEFLSSELFLRAADIQCEIYPIHTRS